MRFPLRFTSDFKLGVTSRLMQTHGHSISFINLEPDAQIAVFPPISSLESIVWIGGSEPLDHGEIPNYTNELAAAGHEVFLQTDGALLRRRIHEFRPASQFRFVFKFEPQPLSHNAIALEAIRAAKLCGFLTCALTQLDDPAHVEALAKLHAELHRLDLDGYMIVTAIPSPELDSALALARHRLLNRRWRRLSAMLDAVVSPVTQAQREVCTARNLLLGSKSVDPDCQEGAQA
jgi:hypothetical protein